MLKRTVTLPLAALSLLTATAFADGTQPGTQPRAAAVAVAPAISPPGADEMPPVPPAPPQNEDWSNVSHINGHPVPVGDRNQYLYSYKKTDIMVDPFSPFLGYYDAAISHGLNQNLAISVGVSGWNTSNETGLQITASAPIYFRRTFSGPYLEPGLIFRTTTSKDEVDYAVCAGCTVMPSSSSGDSWAGPELLFGWHWTFDSGLNIALASGLAKRMDHDTYADGVEVNGYFRAGYAF